MHHGQWLLQMKHTAVVCLLCSLTSHFNVVVMSGQMERSHPVLVPGHHIGMAPQQLLHCVLVATSSGVVEGSQPLAVLQVHLTTYAGCTSVCYSTVTLGNGRHVCG